MSRKEKREVKENKKGTFSKIIKIVKLVLFVTMLVLVFIVSPKIAKYIIDLGYEQLTRVVNMILITVTTAIYFYKK